MAATLTSTVTDSVTLNGSVRGTTNAYVANNITDVFERIVTCTFAQETTIARFSTSAYANPVAIDVSRVRYVRVTNLDPTEKVLLSVVTTASSATIRLMAGGSFILSTGNEVVRGEEDVTPSFATLEDLASLIVKPVSGSVSSQVEVFVAIE